MNLRELSTAWQIYVLLRRIHVHPAYFAVPTALSLGAAVFEGMGMGLLIPLLNGFLTKDFSFLKDLPGLHTVLAFFPSSSLASDRSLFAALLGIFIAIIVLKNILRYATSVSMAYLGTRTVHHLRKQVFDAYLAFGKLYFDRTSVGHHSTLLSQFTTEAFQPLMNTDRFILALFSLLAYFVVMSAISWQLTAFALPLFLILHAVIQRMIRRMRTLSEEGAAAAATLGKKVVEILSTIPLVKAFGTEREEHRRYTAVSDQRARLEFRAAVLRQLIGPLQELITLGAVLLLLSGMLYLLVRDSSIAPPAFLVYFYLVVNATNKFGVLSGFQSTLAHASAPVREVAKVFHATDKFHVPDGKRVFPGLERSIAFRDLHFDYPGGKHVFHGLSFSIEEGKMTALVGPTGVGKTTIVNLLLRYYDCPPGTILLDGADIRTFTASSLRSHIGFVSQETLLLHDTLRANITYGLDDVPEEQLQEVLRSARLDGFIRELPRGLETLIGDRGVRLSGGEKQRVSIARALLRDADILILDEATSSLDLQTEKLLQEALEEAMRGRTSIVIAHRFSTIKHADKIVVIEGGRCTEEGGLETLLAMKGRFSSYWEEQKFR